MRYFNRSNPSTFAQIVVANYSKKEADAIVLRELRLAEYRLAEEVEQHLKRAAYDA